MIVQPISHEDFEPLTGSRFAVLDAGHPSAMLDLIEVTPLKNYGTPDSLRTPFSLLFKSSDRSADIMPQRLYRLSHDDMGELEIFLVPIGRDETGVTYEAAFN
ncbi:DUF6916 family protein [Sphingomonas oligoaromativorans]|uniref:DUF6916 family protein n=1 Tax=Sphingomonas oligoaromativorans TaxID=575322 RepID=UPI001421B618|nr:hypothetical protein [Sphingomonas oligoaromativorans]NIJ33727.1 hypothetical protein [Sphingomonas oligoaromativorans]